MSTYDLPEGWTVENPVSDDAIYSDPPESLDPARIQFYGLRVGDAEPYLFGSG